ncbi:MAG TPA: biopolymer transporter ExbD [Kofleriaceae bacterium]|nr:biopolymer transporter ExbD [Kofleriaceae bacterium]
MGISAGGSRGGPKSDINVTPLVDICLVLLIIFLVAMPILIRHITIEIPRKLAPEEIAVVTGTTIQLCGRADGTVDIDEGGAKSAVNRIELAKTLRPKIEAIKNERVVFVDFDEALKYEEVVSLMDTVKGLGKDVSGNETNPVKVALRQPHVECKEAAAAPPPQ